jgi:hypothetical protein
VSFNTDNITCGGIAKKLIENLIILCLLKCIVNIILNKKVAFGLNDGSISVYSDLVANVSIPPDLVLGHNRSVTSLKYFLANAALIGGSSNGWITVNSLNLTSFGAHLFSFGHDQPNAIVSIDLLGDGTPISNFNISNVVVMSNQGSPRRVFADTAQVVVVKVLNDRYIVSGNTAGDIK